ncbi:MAG: DUF6493 family protein [Actinomycetes bacterium]
MTLTPEALRAAVERGDPDRVREVLAGADEAERRACVPLVKELAGRDGWPPAQRLSPERLTAAADALLAARLGVTGGAAAVATLVRRQYGRRVHDLVVGVLVDRSPPWLDGVVARLVADDTSELWNSPWPVAEALRRHLGLPRPSTPAYLVGVVQDLTPPWSSEPVRGDVLAELRGDPGLRDLVPALLEVPDVGSTLAVADVESVQDGGRWTTRARAPERTWCGAVVALTAEGLLDRSEVLDLCLGALLRGGKREHVGWFVGLHDALAPTDDEVAARLRTYTGLLASGAGPAATLAQRFLKGLDAAGRLDADVVADATRAALARREKGLATAQLSWVQRVARRRPDAVGDLAVAVADGLAHERRDVAERVLAVLEGLSASGPLPESVLDAVRARAADLPVTLRPRAEAVVGPLAPADDPAEPLLVVPPPRSVEPPVGTVDDLVSVAATYLARPDPLIAERVMDGVARLGAPHREELRAALAPLGSRVVPDEQGSGTAAQWFGRAPVHGLLHALITDPPPAPARRLLGFGARQPDHRVYWPDPAGPEGARTARVRELLENVRRGGAQPLLATPATGCGHVDLEALVAAVESAAAAGHDLWQWDLEQAWLRVPRGEVPSALLDRLARVPTPAAGWLRARLVGGTLPDPVVTPAAVPVTRHRWGRAVPTQLAGELVVDVAWPGLADPGSGSLVQRAVAVPSLADQAAVEWWEGPRRSPLEVLLTLPSHREVAAGYVVADAVGTEHRLPDAAREAVGLLPEAEGPTGLATHLALVYTAANADAAARTAAVDALEGFAVRGGLDAAAAGVVLGGRLAGSPVKPGRVHAVLAEVARGPVPARRLVWELLAAALPLALPSRRRGLPDLVGLAAETAAAVGVRGVVPGLGDLADSTGGGRLAVEARRLRDVLQG